MRRARPCPPPALRDLGVEIAALESELLQAYRPPASIESHSIFIRISALLKEAHELNDAAAASAPSIACSTRATGCPA